MVYSFSFLDLGQIAVTDGTGWLVPLVIRSRQLEKVREHMRLLTSAVYE